ncbi:myb/SANT-like DNA-binding domain-containing protein 1 [Dunckerocampus dactyliophorus]|uniref:myb/SANT-like DNA-binding domain-containing protein 1 n=1 Tax=Dunckerocampus dactyliophorus TaxID=161453 RepID=UPI0024060ED1|nr:myb/SANT-like DNA-binding domain-containing protein 1 [Dunckerocampus dactyliophorus]
MAAAAAGDETFSYLIPTHGEKHRRAPNWTDGEMKALLYVWEENHNDLKTSKRNAKVYERMSQRFFQLTGEQRFKEEIKMKITNMSFQYRRLKSTIGESGETPDWPYYKAIEKILSKPLENSRGLELQVGASSQAADNLLTQPEEAALGYLPEYTGSSDDMEIKQEVDSLSSDSEQTQGSSSRPVSAKRCSAKSHVTMKRKKLQLMRAMLQQQKRSNRAIEETCREVRRALHQQNLVQVQCMQLQERMMNLLEKMILPSSSSIATQLRGAKELGKL